MSSPFKIRVSNSSVSILKYEIVGAQIKLTLNNGLNELDGQGRIPLNRQRMQNGVEVINLSSSPNMGINEAQFTTDLPKFLVDNRGFYINETYPLKINNQYIQGPPTMGNDGSYLYNLSSSPSVNSLSVIITGSTLWGEMSSNVRINLPAVYSAASISSNGVNGSRMTYTRSECTLPCIDCTLNPGECNEQIFPVARPLGESFNGNTGMTRSLNENGNKEKEESKNIVVNTWTFWIFVLILFVIITLTICISLAYKTEVKYSYLNE